MINIVQVGYGYWGTNVARNIAASDKTNLYAMCDFDPAKVQRAKNTLGEGPLYSTDYKEFLNDDKVDAFAVAIQTEPSYHVAMDVLNAGKHLFIEKPMATNAQRAQDICELGEKMNRIVHCDHIMIFHPIIRYIKNMYDTGELGDMMYFDVDRVNLGPIRTDVNAMLDLAVHDLAVLDFLSGGKEPIEVDAIGEKRYGEQETLTYLTMKYPGFIAHLKSSWISPLKERRTVIGGTKKMLVFDDMKTIDKLTIYDQGIVKREDDDAYGLYEFKVRTGDMLIPYIPFQDALRNSIEHFAECVVSGTPSEAGPQQALRVVRTLDRAMASMRGQKEK